MVVRWHTYFVGSSSDFLQTIGPSTEGASLSGAEPKDEILRRESTEDLALKLETDIVVQILVVSMIEWEVGAMFLVANFYHQVYNTNDHEAHGVVK